MIICDISILPSVPGLIHRDIDNHRIVDTLIHCLWLWFRLRILCSFHNLCFNVLNLFILINAIYYIGYTFQCVVTKSAQTCVTNDPKQRPLFTVFDAIYNMILFTGGQVFVSSYLAPKYHGLGKDIAMFHEFWAIVALVSALFTAIAVISIWPKDRREYFGTGKAQKITFKDYFEVIKNNKAIQMLVVSASTDKLGSAARTSKCP